FCCDQNGPPARREEGAYLKRYVTDEQRSRRPIFIATLRAGASWLFFLRRGGSTRMTQIWALRSRLEKQPTDLRQNTSYFGDRTLAPQSEFWRRIRRPRIFLKVRALESLDVFRTELENGADLQIEEVGEERLKVNSRQLEEAPGRVETAAIGYVFRSQVLFLQVDECACELNKSFEELMGRAPFFEPEMLEYVVRFIVFLFVETNEITFVIGIAQRSGFQRIDICLNSLALIHFS
ncbi:MAG TPA: hypothetical protein VE860_17740, partial [Chthoniobacterales bacterium]|nr:hypothetical protein [Chthoniobacterales bacterium]